MPTRYFNPVLAKRLRVTQLDSCGRILTSGSNVVSDGFVTVNLSAEIESGNEIMQRNASGALVVNERLADNFKRLTVEVEFAGVNPSLLPIVSNAESYADWAGNAAGITIGEGAVTGFYSLELWTGLAGASCAAGTENAGAYMLLPFVAKGVVTPGSFDGENAVSFTLSGSYTKGGNGWGTGPYLVVLNGSTPATIPTSLDPLDHFLIMETGVLAPTASVQPNANTGLTTTTTTTTTTGG